MSVAQTVTLQKGELELQPQENVRRSFNPSVEPTMKLTAFEDPHP